MLATGRFKVTYVGGNEATIKIGLRAIVEVERRWPGHQLDQSDRMPDLEGAVFAIYVATGGDPKDRAKFDVFIDGVEDVEMLDAEDATPSEPAPTDA